MPGPWFGGWAFDAERPWAGFDAERWVLPEVLAWWDGTQAWLAAFGVGQSDEQLSARLDAVEEVEPSITPLNFTTVPGDRAAWGALVERALDTINSGACSKLVLARVIEATFGRLDVVLLNAGIAKLAPLEHVDEAHYDEHMDVNVKGVVFTLQKVLPLLSRGASVMSGAAPARAVESGAIGSSEPVTISALA